MDLATISVGVLAAVAVMLLLVGLFGGRKAGVNARLEQYAAGQPAAEPAQTKGERRSLGKVIATTAAFGNFDKVVERRDFSANLARELARADLSLKPSEFLAIRAASLLGVPAAVVLLGATVAAPLGNPIAYVVALVAGFMLPRLWLGRRKSGRLKAFNTGLADTITLIANALRSGSSFLQAIEMVVRETEPPISTEFARVIREVNLGLPFEQALENMVRRVRSEDLELMATAIEIQHQVGGNLAEILDQIAYTIRERVRIKGEVKTLTAQGRMSGYVVGFLPVGLGVAISVISPSFMAPMFSKPPELIGLPLGLVVLGIGGLSMALGIFFIRRIVTIEV